MGKRERMNASDVKKMAYRLGADLCGIAPVVRFEHAPRGFHPKDIFENCQSVIVLAQRSLASTLKSGSAVPYSHFNMLVTRLHDELLFRFSLELESRGVQAVPVPVDDPYIHWNPDGLEGKGVLSLRHAAMLAGMGVLGRNTLLKNRDWGNMIRLGAVLVDLKLEGDPLTNEPACPPDCRICLDACPTQALDGVTVNQLKCRPHTYVTTKRGFQLIRCNVCRKVCPDHAGIKRNALKRGES